MYLSEVVVKGDAPIKFEEYVNVDFNSGVLKWKVRPLSLFSSEKSQKTWNTRFSGKECTLKEQGNTYRRISVEGKTYKQHRVILYLYGISWSELEGKEVDHIDGDRNNNSVDNLRIVSRKENARNMKMNKCNKTGVNGVYFDKENNRFRSEIRNLQGNKVRASFSTIDEAAKWREIKELEFGYTKRHGNKE